MHPFTLERPADLAGAISFAGHGTEYIAGGTDMMQLLTDHISRPDRLVAIGNGVLDDRIELREDGRLWLGAGARMADVADHPLVRERFPAISQSLLLSASAQVRNMATIGGNLLQRTRCPYFRDIGFHACNKRDPGTGCAAMDGENRMLAVFGTSDYCIATNPSDLAVALVALDALVYITGPNETRTVPLEQFHRLPADSPHIETVLERGELITGVEVPASASARISHYLKVRDRTSFEFALVSAAVALDVQDGLIREARIAMGGVGTKPWRMHRAEGALVGARNEAESYRVAAERSIEGASPREGNAFKLELMKRTLVRALQNTGSPS